jgi:hypothetical protein
VGRDVRQNGRGSAGVCATPRVSDQLRCRASWRSHCGTTLLARHLSRLAGTHFCSVFLSPPLGARLARLRMRHPRASACAVFGMRARPRTPTHVHVYAPTTQAGTRRSIHAHRTLSVGCAQPVVGADPKHKNHQEDLRESVGGQLLGSVTCQV